jgi:hypothetical protein
MSRSLNGRALSLLLALGSFACQAQADKAAPQAEPAAKPAVAPAAAAPAAAAPAAAAPAAAAPATSAAAAPAESAAPASAAAGSVRTVAAHEAAPQAGSKGNDKPAAPAAPTERQAKRGAAASEEPFSAWLEGDVPLAAGQPATLRVVLQAKPPYHCNAEYPHKFTLAPTPGVTFPAPVAKGMQVTPAEGVLSVPVVAGAAGQTTVKGKLAFSVCTEERCLVEKRELALDVDIQ